MAQNGNTPSSIPKSSLDPAWTNMVVSSMGPDVPKRLRDILAALIKHIHQFTKETNLTIDEWHAGMEFLNETGKASTLLINQLQIVLDCLGMETCVLFPTLTFINRRPRQNSVCIVVLMPRNRFVDEITYNINDNVKAGATPKAVLGQFYRDDAPAREKSASIVVNSDDGQVCFMHGRLIDAVSRHVIKNATMWVWQASTNGLYDQQDPNQMTGNLRGKFQSDENGEYAFYCLKPTPYPIPEQCKCSSLHTCHKLI